MQMMLALLLVGAMACDNGEDQRRKLEADIAQLEAQKREKEEALSALKGERDRLSDKAKSLRAQNDEREDNLKDLTNAHDALAREYSEEQAGWSALHAELQDDRSQDEIELNSKISANKQQIASLEADLAAKKQEIETLTGDLGSRGERIATLEGELADKGATITSLGEILASRDQELVKEKNAKAQAIGSFEAEQIAKGKVEQTLAATSETLSTTIAERDAWMAREGMLFDNLSDLQDAHDASRQSAQSKIADLKQTLVSKDEEISGLQSAKGDVEQTLAEVRETLDGTAAELASERAARIATEEALSLEGSRLLWSRGNYTELYNEHAEQRALWAQNDEGLRAQLKLGHDENLSLKAQLDRELERNKQLLSAQKMQTQMLRSVNQSAVDANARAEQIAAENQVLAQQIAAHVQSEEALKGDIQSLSEANTRLEQALNEAFNADYERNVALTGLEQEIAKLKGERDAKLAELERVIGERDLAKGKVESLEAALLEAAVQKEAEAPIAAEIQALEAEIGKLQESNRKLDNALATVRDPSNRFKIQSQEYIAGLTGMDSNHKKKVSELKRKLQSFADADMLVDIIEIPYDLPISLSVLLDKAPRLSAKTTFFVSGLQGRASQDAKFLIATDDEALMVDTLKKEGHSEIDYYSIELPAEIPLLYLDQGIFVLPKSLLHPNCAAVGKAEQIISLFYDFDNGVVEGLEQFIAAIAPHESQRFELVSRIVRNWNDALNENDPR
jgi:chromosome segregation ATPase